MSARDKYVLNCGGCHGLNGDAALPSVPKLRKFGGYFTHLKQGREFIIRAPGSAMSVMDSKDLAEVTNWWLEAFCGDQLPDDFKPYTAAEVEALRQNPLTLAYPKKRQKLMAKLRAGGIIPSADQPQETKEDWVFQGSPSSPPLHLFDF